MRSFLALFLLVAANALWVQMEPDIQPWVPKGWVQLVEAPKADTVIKTTFALKHTDAQRAALDVALMAAADPQSPTYGQWLSIEDITSFMAIPDEQITIVTNYLESHGVRSYTILVNRDMIQALIPIRTLEAMLQTEFRTFVKKSLRVHRVIKPYYLPAEVAAVVGVVEPLMRFPSSEPRVRITENVQSGANGNWPDYCGTSCRGQITPKVIQTQYNMVNVTSPSSKSSVAVAEFQGQQFDYKDLNGFASACGLKNYTVNVVGTNNEAHCSLYAEACIESLLDIEYLASLTQPIPITDYYDDTYSILDWANTVDADASAPFVHSVSYGNDEAQQTSVAYMNQCNDAFQKVTSRGITLLVASGDQGVWGREGTGTGHFNPDFPASSPYILAVGGSDLSTTSVGPETCCTDGGGGFSNTFARPSWQDAAVTNYLNTATLPNKALYNSTGRGYPDVSAIFGLYIPYCIQADGKFYGVAGTSASSPVAASIIALLNDVRFQKGGAPLGFANPFLYGLLATNPTAFNDITTGQNNGGFSTGFNAQVGWDPCSGLGSLNYANLKNLV